MKRLFLIPLLLPLFLMVSGCVSYYYPVAGTDIDEGPVYVEGDSSYYVDEEPEYRYYTSSYESSLHYPWWSIDYFYLGSHRHRSSFSFGLNYGSPYYDPWYDPFYFGYYPSSRSYFSFYFPLSYSYWNSPYYGFRHDRYGWNDYYWRHRYNRHHGYGDGYHDRGDGRHGDRYAGSDRNRHSYDPNVGPAGRDRNTYRDGDRFAGADHDRDRRRRAGEDGPPGGNNEGGTTSRRVSVAPGQQTSRRGMEVRSREASKPQPTRTEPTRPIAQAKPAPGVRPSPQQNRPVYNTSRSNRGDIRSRAGSKQGATRVSPVESRPATTVRPDVNGITRGSTGIVSSRSGSGTVRSPAQSKSRSVRTQPARPQPSRPQVAASPNRGSASRTVSAPVRATRPARQSTPVRRQASPPSPRQHSAPPPRTVQSSPPRPRSSSSGPRPKSTPARSSTGSKAAARKPAPSKEKDRR